jgi:peptidoglycan/xylan/chitin deacetylase (PgdA/CDA1 family)
MYHRIVADDFKRPVLSKHDDAGLYIRTESEFKKEMAYLADNDYTPISLYQLRDYLLSKDPKLLPAKPVVITFDDGSSDWFEIVFPTLAAHNFKATFFLITDDESRRKYLSDSTPLAWNRIQQMAGYKSNAAANLFNFESHTHTHRNLSAALAEIHKDTNNGPIIVRHELAESMKAIEEKTGRRPRFLALPYGGGGWDAQPDSRTFPVIKSIAREIGYYGIRTSRRDIPNDLTTDPYRLGAQITMLSITSYDQFVQRLKSFE